MGKQELEENDIITIITQKRVIKQIFEKIEGSEELLEFIRKLVKSEINSKENSQEIVELNKKLRDKLEIEENLKEKIEENDKCINELKKIINQKDNDISDLKEFIKDINNKLIKLKEEKEQIIEISNNKNKEIEDIRQKINGKEQKINEAENKINMLLQKINEYDMEKALEIYNVYKKLSFDTKQTLEGTFRGEGLSAFIVCGSQHESIISLWNIMKDYAVEEKKEELKNMQEILDYFIDKYNKIFRESLYIKQEIRMYEDIDEDKHIRSKNSKISGQITEIFIRGYDNTRNPKNIMKSVIKSEA